MVFGKDSHMFYSESSVGPDFQRVRHTRGKERKDEAGGNGGASEEQQASGKSRAGLASAGSASGVPTRERVGRVRNEAGDCRKAGIGQLAWRERRIYFRHAAWHNSGRECGEGKIYLVVGRPILSDNSPARVAGEINPTRHERERKGRGRQ